MPERLFGTDGIRGLANQYPMTGEVAMAVGRAVAHVLRNHPITTQRSSLPIGLKPLESTKALRRAKIVVGKDTRLSGYMIEQALASGICSMGADVILIGPLSTPGVAFVTQSMRADAGIMISASHNPYFDNGIKIFSADGYKLPDDLEHEIERLVLTNEISSLRPTGDLVGKAFRLDDIHNRYVVFLKSLFAKDLDLMSLRIALDCANGAAYKVAPLVFEELGAEVIRAGISPNGLNINEQCGALHPEAVATKTIQYRADIGIALDGDGVCRPVSEATIGFKNNLDDKVFTIDSRYRREIPGGRRECSGNVTVYFEDTTELDIFENEIPVSAQFSFNRKGEYLEFNFGEVKFNGDGTPKISGPGVVKATFDWMAYQQEGSTDVTATMISLEPSLR